MQKKKLIESIPGQSSLVHHPFGRLKGLVKQKKFPALTTVFPELPVEENISEPRLSEEDLFYQAMADVRRIDRSAVAEQSAANRTGPDEGEIFEDDSLSQLNKLVCCGEGFVVSDTPEYMEGTGYLVPKQFALRLHRGDFSIQDHIDLHGFNVDRAREAFDRFMKRAMSSGKRAVLIIHGRGLSSSGDPVLKNKVREWLGQSYWLKRVLAYASAQNYDGGAGATYVLFRSRPVSKRNRKQNQAIGSRGL